MLTAVQNNQMLQPSKLQAHNTLMFIFSPNEEPRVWSTVGPVPVVGVEPLARFQSKSSEESCLKLQLPT